LPRARNNALLTAVPAPAPAATSRARIALAVVAGVIAALIYGGQFVVTRWSMQRTLSSWDLAALRFGVAGILMLPIVVRHGTAGIGWKRSLALAITAGAPYTLIMQAGLVVAPAAHGAVIVPGATPVVSAVLLWLWLGERPWPAKIAGLVLIVIGLVLVGWPALTGGADDAVWVGDLLFVAAAVLWGLFAGLTRRWNVDPIRGTAVVWVMSLAYLPFYFALSGSSLLQAPRGEVVFQAVYQGIGVAIIALVLFSRAIGVLGVSSASLFMPLVPVFGVLLGVPVLGEVPAPIQLLGMAGVTVGIALAAARARA
jgi:drug/metabolite transporter (DMT)-like permease